MRQHVQNVLYGVLDYVAYPAVMLLVAPFLMKSLGVDGYGVWTVMAAVVSAASIIASGFGDAAIKQVSQSRATDSTMVLTTVRVLFFMSGALAISFAISIAVASPAVADRLVQHNSALRTDCVWSLIAVAVLIAQRSVEGVFIATQRAFERYGAAVHISVVARVGSLILGTLAAHVSHRVWSILLVTAGCNIAGTILQHHRVRTMLCVDRLQPGWHSTTAAQLFTFGKYSWLLAVSGIVFGQLDRIILGMWLGASSTAAYAICAQIAQPIYGVSAAGLHALFPYLAHRVDSSSSAGWHRAVVFAALGNVAFAVVASFALQVIGTSYFVVLGRSGMPSSSQHLLVTLLWASALLSLSVVPTYALYALDRVHLVTLFNVVGALLCLVCMVLMGRRWGVEGIAFARLAYGGAGLLLYLPLLRAMNRVTSSIPFLQILREDA